MVGLDPVVDLIETTIAAHWGITGMLVVPHHGGMNSQTWWVGEDYVAKSVPAPRTSAFVGGLRVATTLEAAGIPAGAPVPTHTGEIVCSYGGNTLALLHRVRGTELTKAAAPLIGNTLGRVHLALADLPGEKPFDWLSLDQPHLDLRPWLRPAIEAVLAEYEALGPSSLTWGGLHSDPAPEAFVHNDATGEVAVIDWSVNVRGPLLYDVASAVMYVNPPAIALLESYLATGVLSAAELERGLPTMLRYRYAIQAYYFAYRIWADDRTGITDDAENEEGLEFGRSALLRR